METRVFWDLFKTITIWPQKLQHANVTCMDLLKLIFASRLWNMFCTRSARPVQDLPVLTLSLNRSVETLWINLVEAAMKKENARPQTRTICSIHDVGSFAVRRSFNLKIMSTQQTQNLHGSSASDITSPQFFPWKSYLSICLSIYLSICLPIYLSIRSKLSIYLSMDLSIYLSNPILSYHILPYPSICLSIYLSVYLSIRSHLSVLNYLSIYLSMDLSIYLSNPILSYHILPYPSICLSIYLSVCLSIYLSVLNYLSLSLYGFIYLSI